MAGGGGGGGNGGGGGGAGAVRNVTIGLTANTNYAVTVGAGGAGGSAHTIGGNGGNSIFSTVAVAGGGGGASRDAGGAAQSGGSGGGGGGVTGGNPSGATAGSGVSGQGYNGGNGTWADFGCNAAGGGGGGHAGPGTAAGNMVGGNGGSGSYYYITGSGVIYAAGGGGGRTCTNSTLGIGGSGIGGNGGGNPTVATNGAANTGSGGGGGGQVGAGGTGGSGVVIIRYLDYSAGYWSSSNTSIATVNSSGLVTGISPGTATIQFNSTCSGVSSKTVTVYEAPKTALHFDGTNDYVNMTSSVTELGKANFTIEAWIKTTGVSCGIVTCSDGSTSWNPGEKVLYLNSAGYPTFVGWGNYYINSNQAVNDGKWHHIAVVWAYAGSGTSGTPKMYIDGADKTAASDYVAHYDNFGNFKLGVPNYNYGEAPNFFNGAMDEIRIWNTARSQAQIQAGMVSPIGSPASGLMAYYNFDEGTAGANNTGLSTLTDHSGNNFHGTLTNLARSGSTSNWVESYAMVVPVVASASNITASGFTANWSAPAVGTVTNYLLDVSTNSAFSSFVSGYNSKNVGTATSSAVTGLSPVTTYYYRVRADKTSVTGQGANSGTTVATTYSNISTLSGLTISSGTLSPVFSSATTSYSASVANSVSSITVRPTKTQTNATIQVQVNSQGYSTVASGNISSALALNTGNNAINVRVIAQDGSATIYTVTVDRQALVPTITSFTPLSGQPGTSVTITGTNFNATAANNVVFFGATRATVTAASATSLMVTVPAGAAHAPITVLNTATTLATYSSRFFLPTFSPNKGSITTADMAPKADFATGNEPFSVAIGDIDGDGKPDLAIANFNSNTVSVLRNTGSSGTVSFAAKTDFTTGIAPHSVAIGDIDGDGKPDLVTANYSSNSVSVLRNTGSNGTVSFATKADFTTGGAPTSVAIGDIDGDGKPDLAIANLSSTYVSVLRNIGSSGTVSFAAKADFV
ncbi:hypothetical protein F0P94_17400, partial [Adhaeribacter soli]